MARKRSARSQGGSSSPNTVLVVFLVLFILATLGLGGWVYSIFGERRLAEWEVSWLPGRVLDRNSATTAMTGSVAKRRRTM